MEQGSSDLNREINNELTKAYIAGLVDGVATITVRVKKDSDYSFDFSLEPHIQINRTEPFAIQIVDDWTAKSGIFGTVRQYEDKYQYIVTRNRDIRKFLEEIRPFVQDNLDVFDIMLEDILPKLEQGRHLEDKEGFLEVLSYVDELRESRPRSGKSSKYTEEFFREKWDM